MNGKSSREFYKKFILVNPTSDIIFFHSFANKFGSFVIVQNREKELTLHEIELGVIHQKGQVKVQSSIHCVSTQQRSSLAKNIWFIFLGCANGSLIQLKIVEEQIECRMQKFSEVSISKFPLKQIFFGRGNSMCHILDLNGLFSTLIFDADEGDKVKQTIQTNIQLIAKLEKEKSQFIAVKVKGANFPYVLTLNELDIMINTTNIEEEINIINEVYGQNIDQNHVFQDITTLNLIEINEKLKIVIGTQKGEAHICIISAPQHNNKFPAWYKRDCIKQFSMDTEGKVLSASLYRHCLCLASYNKIFFIDIKKKMRIYSSLMQKSNSPINQIRWIKQQQILMCSTLTGCPKTYLYTKQLPIQFGSENLHD